MGSTWAERFWFGWFYVVNGSLVVQVNEPRWEGLGGCKNLAKACNMGGLGMLAWVIVLDWVRIWDYAC